MVDVPINTKSSRQALWRGGESGRSRMPHRDEEAGLPARRSADPPPGKASQASPQTVPIGIEFLAHRIGHIGTVVRPIQHPIVVVIVLGQKRSHSAGSGTNVSLKGHKRPPPRRSGPPATEAENPRKAARPKRTNPARWIVSNWFEVLMSSSRRKVSPAGQTWTGRENARYPLIYTVFRTRQPDDSVSRLIRR